MQWRGSRVRWLHLLFPFPPLDSARVRLSLPVLFSASPSSDCSATLSPTLNPFCCITNFLLTTAFDLSWSVTCHRFACSMLLYLLILLTKQKVQLMLNAVSLNSLLSICSCWNPYQTGSNLHLLRPLQAPGNQPVQPGRTQATTETPEEGEEEGDGTEPVGWRRQTACQHHPGLRHPVPQAAEQVSTGD